MTRIIKGELMTYTNFFQEQRYQIYTLLRMEHLLNEIAATLPRA
jgi:hypothetical protein